MQINFVDTYLMKVYIVVEVHMKDELMVYYGSDNNVLTSEIDYLADTKKKIHDRNNKSRKRQRLKQPKDVSTDNPENGVQLV